MQHLRRFVDAVRKPWIEMRLDDVDIHQNQPNGDVIRWSLLPGDRVKAFILPKDLNWPTFFANKQSLVSSPNIYFQRLADTHGHRQEATIKLLKQRRTVISIGLAGIGKSTELNSFLMEFVSNIGKEGWPQNIFYRVDSYLYKISSSSKSGSSHVDVKLLSRLASSFDTIREFTDSFAKIGVLLLELGEFEFDPHFIIPTYISLSNKNAYSITKTLEKAGVPYMLIDPPRKEDVIEMAVYESKYSSSTSSAFSNKTEAEIREIVGSLIDIIGPVPRYILVNESDFRDIESEILGQADKIFGELKKVSVNVMPEHAKYYLAAFIEDDNVKIPLVKGRLGFLEDDRWIDPSTAKRPIYEIKFLSNNLAAHVAKMCNSKILKKLMNSPFKYIVCEQVMCHGLMKRTRFDMGHEKFLYENWSIYRNSSELAENLLLPLDSSERPKMTPCENMFLFKSMYLTTNVSELKSGTLYKSSAHNGALFDALIVDHNNKALYMFQSSSMAPDKHSLDYYTINTVMTKLQMFDKKNKGYKVVYIYCTDASTSTESGCVISNNSELEDKDTDPIYERFTIFIARILFFPNATSEQSLKVR
jgi:hypothetical protein